MNINYTLFQMKHQCTQHSIDHQMSPAQLSGKYCMETNFGGRDFSGFGVMAPFVCL